MTLGMVKLLDVSCDLLHLGGIIITECVFQLYIISCTTSVFSFSKYCMLL